MMNLATSNLAFKPTDMIDSLGSIQNRRHVGGRFLICFEQVEPNAKLFASIIGQAVTDSMPDIIFSKRSMEPLFSSGVPEIYDAYDFMTSDRVNMYANMINMDVDTEIRGPWLSNYRHWCKTSGVAVAQNIFDQVVKLLSRSPQKSVQYMDAKSFLMSPQFNYWCGVANVSSQTQRDTILSAAEHHLSAKLIAA
ncbi:MAG: hypothetical protein CTY35_00460 [Methylotenera sp.]|uniref:hypothetical protein n=1 Tax=Methylotenera sp. TaxID=2051956 RepID=UPI000D46EABD|nr:hypothetical protein [Methylotenera sp.]PPC84827.1 MAG: hypothetical protein CTY38_00455 [Methylotenera sp.]PPD02187.1 MAG: hypothetical protein CTY35_00460 [Methylotenera sp.]